MTTNLTGSWLGHYVQNDQPRGIRAHLVQTGERLTGTMRDLETDFTHSIFDVAVAAGLQPGADEQIEERLRELFPESGKDPIQYVTHLPEDSIIDGSVSGVEVSFTKTYQGVHYGGYRVGEHLLGMEVDNHKVRYQGRIIGGGTSREHQGKLRIEGLWWIDPSTDQSETRRTEGVFLLHRTS